jgi:hypothetical protein
VTIKCFIGGRRFGFDGLSLDFLDEKPTGIWIAQQPGDNTFTDATWVPYEEGVEGAHSSFCKLTHPMEIAFWEAINQYRDPPTESKALREALDLERKRVDHMLTTFLGQR